MPIKKSLLTVLLWATNFSNFCWDKILDGKVFELDLVSHGILSLESHRQFINICGINNLILQRFSMWAG